MASPTFSYNSSTAAPSARSRSSSRVEVEDQVVDWAADTHLNGIPEDPARSAQRVVIERISTLIGPVTLTFREREERVRKHSNTLPPVVYRMQFEHSATQCEFVTPDSHVKNRRAMEALLGPLNAFQNLGDFNAIKDMNAPRLQKHLEARTVSSPTGYVSTFKSIKPTLRRAKLQYTERQKVGHRIVIADIDTADLIPATMRSRRQDLETSQIGEDLSTFRKQVFERDSVIPVWVRPTCMPADRSPISLQNYYDSQSEMWISTNEWCKSDIQLRASPSHANEWVSCGPILKTSVARVRPFDGQTLHDEKSFKEVKSIESRQNWVFNWPQRRWLENPDMTNMSDYRYERPGEQRERELEISINIIMDQLRPRIKQALSEGRRA